MKNKLIIILALVIILISGIIGVSFIIKNTGTSDVPAVAQSDPSGNAASSPTVSEDVYSILPRASIKVESLEEESLRITAVGDILLGRGVGSRLKNENKDFIYPFLEVADILKKGDIVFGNLEEPITASTRSLVGIKQGGKYVLKNDVEAMEGLKYAGFNLFSLANNHILDYYEQGLYDTISILDENGIAYSGAGKNMEEARKPAIVEKKNVKIGLLSYTDMSEVTYKGNPPLMFIAGKDKAGVAPRPVKFNDFIKSDIEAVRDEVDILMVSLHWGVEESFEVLKSQREFAYSLIDSGVDVVLGHHPHQFQGIEFYKDKPIFYSLGNFIFDQNDPENQEAFIINMDFKNNDLTDLEAIPVRTINKTQVVPQTGQNAKAMLEREQNLCNSLKSKCFIKDDKLIFDID